MHLLVKEANLKRGAVCHTLRPPALLMSDDPPLLVTQSYWALKAKVPRSEKERGTYQLNVLKVFTWQRWRRGFT